MRSIFPLYRSQTSLRVRYGETDKMGYAYYGHYASYFEVARVEALRQLGITYRELEERGIMLPVLEYQVKFFKPAFYDDLLRIETIIPEVPGVRIKFNFETFNQQGVCLNKAHVTLVFIDMKRNKPCEPPPDFILKMKPYFHPNL